MMPYQNLNPNYFAQYPQYFQQTNPYTQRLENLQQFQQALNPAPVQNQFSVLGKMIESIEIVKATDIPMDGNMYYFPKADGTEIYAKAWGNDGRTRILTFKPVLEDNPNNTPSDDIKIQFGAFGDVLGAIQSELKTLSDKVDKISKPLKAQKGNADE